MKLGKRKKVIILVPLVLDRSSTNSHSAQKRIIICSALCGAKVSNNCGITKKIRRKVLKIRNNQQYSFEIQNFLVILHPK